MFKVKLKNCRFNYCLILSIFLSTNILTLNAHANQENDDIREAKALIKNHSEKEIESFARQNQWKYVDIETEVWVPDSWIESNPCHGKISVHRGSSRKPWGRVSYEIRCSNPEWETRGRSQTDIKTDAAVSATVLRRGHTITEKDIDVERVEINRSYLQIFPNKDSLVGKRVRRTIHPNDIIDPRFIDKAYLVQENQPVIIEVNQLGIEASMSGIAMEDGALGETVTVKNKNSGKAVPGTVVDKNKVLVNF